MTNTGELLTRFEWMFDPEPTTGCWLWAGSRISSGYGAFARGPGQWELAHRVAYEIYVGPVAEGLELDHLCRTKLCVNPRHLEPVTHRENMQRHFRLKTHCAQGHELVGSNVRIRRGWRECQTCARRHNGAPRRHQVAV